VSGCACSLKLVCGWVQHAHAFGGESMAPESTALCDESGRQSRAPCRRGASTCWGGCWDPLRVRVLMPSWAEHGTRATRQWRPAVAFASHRGARLISSKTSPSSRNPISLKPRFLYSDAAARLVGLCIVLIRDAPNSAISAIASCIAAMPIPCR